MYPPFQFLNTPIHHGTDTGRSITRNGPIIILILICIVMMMNVTVRCLDTMGLDIFRSRNNRVIAARGIIRIIDIWFDDIHSNIFGTRQ